MPIFGALPFILQNGTVADATQVMADFNKVIADGNANAAENGVNSSITALLGLTTPIPIAGGSSTHFIGATSGGSAAAQTVATTIPANWALTTGFMISFVPGFSSTGATTLNVAGTGVLAIRKPTTTGPAALVANDLVAGQMVTLVYDGTAFLTQSEIAYPALFATQANLASATTTDLGTIGSHNINITGTTTIVGFGSTALTSSPIFLLQFAASLKLTFNATSMILPGGADIQTAAGDFAIAMYKGSGNWQVMSYFPALPVPNTIPQSGDFKNLSVIVLTDTTLQIQADELTLKDVSGRVLKVTGVSNVNTITGSGANGLDTGALATQNFYYGWIIYNPTTLTIASVISLSSAAPTLPSGYTFAMRVCAVFFATTSRLWRTRQFGRSVGIVPGTFPVALPIISSGSVGTYSNVSPTLASVTLTGIVPPTAGKAFIHGTNDWKGNGNNNVLMAPSTAWGGTNNGPQGSNGMTYPIWFTTGMSSGFRADVVLESLSLGFASDGNGGAISCAGWEDNL